MRVLLPTIAMLLFLLSTPLPALCAERTDLVIEQTGQAQVTERRQGVLPAGAGTIVLPGLPATCRTDSLTVRATARPPRELEITRISPTEPLTQDSLLRRFLGKTVTLIIPDGQHADGAIRKQVTVLAAGSRPLFRMDGRIYAGPYTAILYPAVPAGLSVRPGLEISFINRGQSTRQTLETSCLAGDISWRMNYALDLSTVTGRGRLSGWAAIANKSGTDFRGAHVELLAGRPSNAARPPLRAFLAAGQADKMTEASPASREIFAYHLYTLPGSLDLPDGRTLLLRLFRPATIPVRTWLQGEAQALEPYGRPRAAQERLDAFIAFRNDTKSGLGMPLPAGELRAYEEISGVRRIIGESAFPDMARDAEARMNLGQAFDVSVERVPTRYEKTNAAKTFRAAWELRIRNAGSHTRRVILREEIPGDWSVENASRKWTRPEAGVLEFSLDVPPTRENAPLVVEYAVKTSL